MIFRYGFAFANSAFVAIGHYGEVGSYAVASRIN